MPLFYPSHDIALGNGVKHFNPPFAALRLQEDLASLAEIWQRNDVILPWAWDWDTRDFIRKEYKKKSCELPTDEELAALRSLSSRKTTISILSKLKETELEMGDITTPIYLDSYEMLKEYIENNQNYVLKTPWSSSGRGLSKYGVVPKDVMLKHGAATIKKMGGIIAEKWYDKIQDFAMLFYVGKEEVSFVGYSLFDNDEAGTYRSGKLMSNQLIEASLPQECESIKKNLLSILTDMMQPFMHKNWEVGYIGIDMMIARADDNDEDRYFVHPCIEMNLRCTMGVVARLFFDHNCKDDQIGDYFITPALDCERLTQMDKDFRATYHNQYFRLTDINDKTLFMAYAIFS